MMPLPSVCLGLWSTSPVTTLFEMTLWKPEYRSNHWLELKEMPLVQLYHCGTLVERGM